MDAFLIRSVSSDLEVCGSPLHTVDAALKAPECPKLLEPWFRCVPKHKLSTVVGSSFLEERSAAEQTTVPNPWRAAGVSWQACPVAPEEPKSWRVCCWFYCFGCICWWYHKHCQLSAIPVASIQQCGGSVHSVVSLFWEHEDICLFRTSKHKNILKLLASVVCLFVSH